MTTTPENPTVDLNIDSMEPVSDDKTVSIETETETEADDTHDYELVGSIGTTEAQKRLRCKACMQYRDRNPGPCTAPEAEDEVDEPDDIATEPDATDEPDDVADPDGHEYEPIKGSGNVAVIRCVHCHHQENTPRRTCVPLKDESDGDPIDRITQICADVLENALGSAIISLIAGYEGNKGTGPAYDAGSYAAGRQKRHVQFHEQLEFLVASGPVGFQFRSDTYVVQHGKTTVNNASLADAVKELHQKTRPACPNCGSTTYVECYGSLGTTGFEPKSCDQCSAEPT